MNWQLDKAVVLFAFSRPASTQVILDQLCKISPKKVYVFLDAPKLNDNKNIIRQKQVLRLVGQYKESLNIELVVRDYNFGIREQTHAGLDYVFSKEDCAIILEDDCQPDLTFFEFCSQLLDLYRKNNLVGVIGGFNPFPDNEVNPSGPSYYFTQIPMTWGWATWKDVWLEHDKFAKKWLETSSQGEFLAKFNSQKTRRYWRHHLNSVTKSENHQIWDYQFTFSQWSRDIVAVIPAISLVQNTGFSIDATHTRDPESWLAKIPAREMNFPLLHPEGFSTNEKLDFEIQSQIFSMSLLEKFAIKILAYIGSKRLTLLAVKMRSFTRKLGLCPK